MTKPLLTTDVPRIRIGVSSCLLGELVRHDGGHRRDRYLTDMLGSFFEWVPVCPELEAGMGVPREAVHLEQSQGQMRLVGVRSGADHTEAMLDYAPRRLDELVTADLSGYILKKDSPSCGLIRVRVHQGRGQVTRTGRGLFAAALAERCPTLPIEEEGRLNDEPLRENWINRVFAYRRLQNLWNTRWSQGDLIRFHTSHKLVLLAHSPSAYQALGRLVADAKPRSRSEVRDQYERAFMAALTRLTSRGRHCNVLHHMFGYVSDQIDDGSRRELIDAIEDFRREYVPLAAPLTLIAHHARRLGVDYLMGQVYLAPHPKELDGVPDGSIPRSPRGMIVSRE